PARGAAPGNGGPATGDASLPVVPRIDLAERALVFDLEETGTSRLALYDALLALADRWYVFLMRPADNRVAVQLKARGAISADALAALAADAARALAQVARAGRASTAIGQSNVGLPHLQRTPVDIDRLVAELQTADAQTLGLGFEPERGPGHENLRVMNIL